MSHEIYMRMALDLAREAETAGEVPVGAVLVLADQVIGRGRNASIGSCDATAHAEILALRGACAAIANYRLEAAILYTTLEPCVMCAGALVAARVARLVFGARDLRFGGVRSKFSLADAEVLNHRLAIEEGVLGAECAELMQRFFADRRSPAVVPGLHEAPPGSALWLEITPLWRQVVETANVVDVPEYSRPLALRRLLRQIGKAH